MKLGEDVPIFMNKSIYTCILLYFLITFFVYFRPFYICVPQSERINLRVTISIAYRFIENDTNNAEKQGIGKKCF